MKTNTKPTKVTKVLIHKIHGGRKKDSKFWNDEITIDNAEKRPNTRIKNNRQPTLDTITKTALLCLPTIILLIVFKPSWFPFLDYHKIYNVVSGRSQINEPLKNHTEYAKPIQTAEFVPIHNPTENKYLHKDFPPTTNFKRSRPNTYRPDNINLEGKVFSWIDSEGKRHFSNTNYPKDNPTLQVQTEINTYRKVTKIHTKGNQIYVPVTLKNNGRSTTLSMLLDTGCTHTNVPYSKLNYLKAKYGNTVYSKLANGSKTKGRVAKIDSIKIGSQIERNFTVTGSKVAGSNNTGLLGMDFLKTRTFKIDYKNQFLIWI